MIYEREFKDGHWTSPNLAEFSTDRDETPFRRPNGEYFSFGSERLIPNNTNQGNFDMNIWVMEKINKGWSEPKPLSEPINDVQIAGEEWPS